VCFDAPHEFGRVRPWRAKRGAGLLIAAAHFSSSIALHSRIPGSARIRSPATPRRDSSTARLAWSSRIAPARAHPQRGSARANAAQPFRTSVTPSRRRGGRASRIRCTGEGTPALSVPRPTPRATRSRERASFTTNAVASLAVGVRSAPFAWHPAAVRSTASSACALSPRCESGGRPPDARAA